MGARVSQAEALSSESRCENPRSARGVPFVARSLPSVAPAFRAPAPVVSLGVIPKPAAPMRSPDDPPLPARSFPSFWTLHLAGWSALGVAMWLGVLSHVEHPAVALGHKLIFATLGATLTLALRPLYRRLYRRGLSLPALAGVSAACSYALSLPWSASYAVGTRAFDAAVLGIPFTLGPPQTLVEGALFYSFILVAWSVLYFAAKYYAGLQAARERALAAEGAAHEARLQALRYQVNPHFLFNTLNAVSTLIVERENGNAARMVARLSDFLRLTLECEATAEVPLAEEVDFAQRYLEIEQIRFGDRLRVTIDVDPAALSARVPPLLLQPLVENAVRHGILPREAGGHLSLEGRRAGPHLLLRVVDDGPGFDAPATSDRAFPDAARAGVGLANVRDRLRAHYGDDFTFTVEPADGGGCAVRLVLPFRTEAASRLPAPPHPVRAPSRDSAPEVRA